MQEHKIERTITEVVYVPAHAKRIESKEFKVAKRRLKSDGHYKCFVGADCEGELEVHHFGCEYSLWNDCDPEKLKEYLELWDIYGYSKLLKHMPITSVDDIRNLMVLCRKHHIEKDTGIHMSTLPVWNIQKLCLAGKDPVHE